MVKKLVVCNELCTGCGSCEMACSFHHNSCFSRKKSSVHIRRMENEGKFEIIIYNEKRTERPVCDLCSNETIPLCIKVCSPKAIVME